MKCPHCGSDMKPEQVFCEHCGKERLLVPVFEPEIEDSVAESMSTIVQELSPEETAEGQTDQLNTEEDGARSADEIETIKNDYEPVEKKHSTRPLIFLVAGVLVMIVLIAVFSVTFSYYTVNSYDYQYQKALEAYEGGRLDEAMDLANRCLELESSSFEVRMLILHIYQEMGETDQVVERCLAMLQLDPDNQELYEILFSIYIEREDYEKLSSLLTDCPIQAIQDAYREYAATPPEFESPGGIYDSVLYLKLIGVGTGEIFYTLDGEEPSRLSERYRSPIKLVSGTYVVSAFYENEYGVKSDVVTQTFEIESGISITPEISLESGSYDMPMAIRVTVPDMIEEDYKIYYTTNGTDPTPDSSEYSVAFPMPLGHSEFRFLMLDEANGLESEVIIRTYDCNPPANFTPEQACDILKQHLIARGEILDLDGRMNGTDETKQYVCNSALSADQVAYYIIYEYIQNGSGSMIRSGNVFAFSVSDATIFRASISPNGNLSLSEF
ncbi:MAG: chitobiase/beta-hexosaminidase C-terminal domain-containing protein [Lachnospiraceae bacterium]|nr:chitobiase/beta-hexosaminidase C-terminal domain-containing protein [Lachnospiraceae bacterium]